MPNFIKLIHSWGGVTIVYRKTMQDSPAYINNHEELQKALQEGIFYLDKLEPQTTILNQFGHVESLICQKKVKKEDNTWETIGDDIKIPARSILVATGTSPNTAYEFEHRGTFTKQGLQYQHYEDKDGELTIAHGVEHSKDENFGPFTSYHSHDKRISLIGDTHPVFHGNVVKAITSGMKTYPKILEVLKDKIETNSDNDEYQKFKYKIAEAFSTTVNSITRRTENIIEIEIKAPLAAKQFRPGQFYRLQNYETYAPKVNHTSLQIEPLALIAFEANLQKGLLKFMVIESGASSKLCSTFKVGDPIALMGPTGVKGKISKEHETVLIIGNQLSIPMLASYGQALKQSNNKVLYVGHFKDKNAAYNKELIEKSADQIIWVTENENTIKPTRSKDISTSGDAIDALMQYAENENGGISLKDVDRVYVIGNTNLLRRFQQARNNEFKDHLIKAPLVFGSVYSTMQCMLKGVCAQCLQWQIDPETGKRTKAVFACSWPDQPLELIDFDNLDERRNQNKLQEHLSNLWVDHLINQYHIERV